MVHVSELLPFVSVSMHQMMTLNQLRMMARKWPAFAAVKAAYNFSWFGLTPFAPVIGNPKVSVLRQLHDYSRVYTLVVGEEGRRGSHYDWLVHARLEAMWLAPHLPLSLLDPRLLWVPPRSGDGVSDRHAAVPRRFAEIYFRARWQLLQQHDLLDVIPIESLTSDDPEHYLENVMIARGVPLGAFPIAAYIGCCTSHERCFQRACHREVLSRTLDCATARHRAMARAVGDQGEAKRESSALIWEQVLEHDSHGGGCLAAGKSGGELMEGVLNYRWLQCRGARLIPDHPVAVPAGRPTSTGQLSPAAWVRHYGNLGPKASAWNLWQGKVVISVPRSRNKTKHMATGTNRWSNSALQSLLMGLGAGSRSDSPNDSRRHKDQSQPLWTLDRVGVRPGERGKAATAAAASPLTAVKVRMVPSRWQVDPTACPLNEPPLWPGSRRYGPSWPLHHEAPVSPPDDGHVGFCAETGEGEPGDCESGQLGGWGLGPSFAERRITSLQECARVCYQYCPRCRYVSFSARNADCSWFHSCDLVRLRTDAGPPWNGETYRSTMVRRPDNVH